MYVNQPTNQPTTKVAAAGVGGSLTVLVIYVLGLFGVDLPPEVASALSALISFGAGYIVKERA